MFSSRYEIPITLDLNEAGEMSVFMAMWSGTLCLFPEILSWLGDCGYILDRISNQCTQFYRWNGWTFVWMWSD